jgi:hypothetical protein
MDFGVQLGWLDPASGPSSLTFQMVFDRNALRRGPRCVALRSMVDPRMLHERHDAKLQHGALRAGQTGLL